MAEMVQIDPALRQLLLRKTGNISGEIPSEETGAEEIPVIAKLIDPSVPIESLRIVARFGQVVTARVPLSKIVEVRRHSNVASLKASQVYHADLAFSVPEIHASPETSNGLIGAEGFTGRGVIIGIVDWGCDFAHVNFRDKEDQSRILYLWDQRGDHHPQSPEPFGYGREFNRKQINYALLQPDPYVALGYDHSDADPRGIGTHCTHVMDIAAGNGRASGSSPGVAPKAKFIVVHLMGEDVRPGGTLGDSVRVGEAVHYIFGKAQELKMPAVVNLSLGKTAGAHDGKTLLEQAFDYLLHELPGRAIVMSAGNYFDADMHTSGQLQPGEYVDLLWLAAPTNDEIAEMDIWYAGSDRFNIELIDPNGQSVARVAIADSMIVKNGERILASIFHRRHDPNNGDNHIVIFLWPDAMLGTWTVRLLGETVLNGTYHAWIERDDPIFQSRFARERAVETSTTGTICNGRNTITVGAYDAREPTHPLAPFSSSGPTRDSRQKPEIAAPGVGILAARSSQPTDIGPRVMNELTIKSGTSMASPHVAGVIALMYQAAGERHLIIDQTREILFKTARSESLGDRSESEKERLRYGVGRVNAAAAVKAVLLMKQTEAASQTMTATTQNLALPVTLSEEHEEREFRENEPAYPERADRTDAISIEKDSEDALIMSKANKEQPQNVTDFARIDQDVASLRSSLALILSRLLVEIGDSELHRVDQYGKPIYDKRQPITFGPTGKQYKLNSASQFSYHATPFVLNTAYSLGFEVPVYPLYGTSSRNGQSYNNTAKTFLALLGDPGVVGKDYFLRYFDIIVCPGQSGSLAIKPGDILLHALEPQAPFEYMGIIVDPTLHDMKDSFFTSSDALRGRGVQCIDAGLSIHRHGDYHGKALTDEQGRVLLTRMVIRFRADAIDIPRVREKMARDVRYRQMLEQASRQSEEVEQHMPDEFPYSPGISIPEENESSQKQPLTGDEKLRIIDRIAQFESARNLYGAINADGEYKGRFNRGGRIHPAYNTYHIGLSYGIVQFTQDSGNLGRLLTMMKQRDKVKFYEIFGQSADELIRVTTAPGPSSSKVPDGRSNRVQSVEGADLWEEPWLTRFKLAAKHVPFQIVQQELAVREFIDPMLQFVKWLGLDTDRALTMVIDRAVNMGKAGAQKWIIGVVSPIKTSTQRLQALAACQVDNILSFQKTTTGLKVDGAWGPMTHAALIGTLKTLDKSPIQIMTREQMMDALVRASTGKSWEKRITQIYNAKNFTDILYEL